MLLLLPLGVSADESKYFRSDAGIAAKGSSLPDDLSLAGAQRWRTAVDSGHSTPVVSGERIFLTTFNGAQQQLATVAVDANSGKVVWKQLAPAEKIEAYHRQTGNPAVCSPACDGERLYVFFGSCGLLCYDLNGKLLWRNAMGPFQDEYGAGSSPVLLEDKIILLQDHDQQSFVTALDRRTGKELWKTSRPDAIRSYSTPVSWVHNGRTELLVAGALELAAYDAATGEKLWWTPGLARIVIPEPVPMGDTVLMASWAPGGDAGKRIALDSWEAALAKWDKNHDGKLARAEVDDPNVLERFYRMDLDQSGNLDQKEWDRYAEVFRRAENALLAIKPSVSRGQLSAGDIVWKYTRGVPYVSSPLLDKGVFWMVKDGGIATKLDAATGKFLQEERLAGAGNYLASPVSGDGKVYFAGEQGTVTVVANQPDWKIISSRSFREKIYATPVIDRGRLFLRTEKALYCFGVGGGSAN